MSGQKKVQSGCRSKARRFLQRQERRNPGRSPERVGRERLVAHRDFQAALPMWNEILGRPQTTQVLANPQEEDMGTALSIRVKASNPLLYRRLLNVYLRSIRMTPITKSTRSSWVAGSVFVFRSFNFSLDCTHDRVELVQAKSTNNIAVSSPFELESMEEPVSRLFLYACMKTYPPRLQGGLSFDEALKNWFHEPPSLKKVGTTVHRWRTRSICAYSVT